MTSERKPCLPECRTNTAPKTNYPGSGIQIHTAHAPACPNAQNFKGCLPECRPFDHAPECSAPEEWRRKLADPGDVRLSCEDPACDLPRRHRPPHRLKPNWAKTVEVDRMYAFAPRNWSEEQRDRLRRRLSSTAQLEAEAERDALRAEVERLREEYELERKSNVRECARVDSYAKRIDELEYLCVEYAADEAARAHTVVDSQQAVLDEGQAIRARQQEARRHD